MTDLQNTPAVAPEDEGGNERVGLRIAGAPRLFVGWGLGVFVNVLLHVSAHSAGGSIGWVRVYPTLGPYAWGVLLLGVVHGRLRRRPDLGQRASRRSGPLHLPGTRTSSTEARPRRRLAARHIRPRGREPGARRALPAFCIATQSGHIRSSASRQSRQNVRPQNAQRKVAGAPHRWQVPDQHSERAPYRRGAGDEAAPLKRFDEPVGVRDVG